MAHGARSKFGALMFEPVVFRKQIYCIEKVFVTLLGRFRAPRRHSAHPYWFGAWGIAPTLPVA